MQFEYNKEKKVKVIYCKVDNKILFYKEAPSGYWVEDVRKAKQFGSRKAKDHRLYLMGLQATGFPYPELDGIPSGTAFKAADLILTTKHFLEVKD